MQSPYTDEHDQYRRALRRFLDTELDPHIEKYLEAGGHDTSLWKKAGEAGLLGVTIVAGDHSELVLLDSKLKPTKTKIKMPLGQGGFGEFSDDGKRIVAVWSTPDSATDIFSIDAISSSLATPVPS